MQRRRQRKKLRTDRLIFLFIITTIIVTILTLAKYKSTIATEESSIKVAFPAIDLLSDEILDVDINPTTEDKEFIFAVTNTEEELQGNGNITDDINFNFNEDKTDTYMLIIKWKEGQTDYRYSHTIDYVRIVVNGVQAD